MPFDPTLPYLDLPRIPPPVELETRAVLKACVTARAAVAELNQAGSLLPNQSILINSIPLLEAKASSEIENIVTTTDRLFRFAADATSAQADPATREALRYRTALRRGAESLRRRPLSTATAVEVCRALLDIRVDVRKIPGTALVNQATGKVVYTPPHGETLLRDLLGNWEMFLHTSEQLDPLVRMAVGHYQFEAIHPFVDGNGRTGRILNSLYLVECELLSLPILYLSRAIIRRKAEYYQLLNQVTATGAWEAWIVYILEGVAETARWTTERIHAIRELMQQTTAYAKEAAPGVYRRELVELIFEQPYCRIQNVVDAGIAKRETASLYLKALVHAGVLEEIKAGRERLFVNTRLMELLLNETPERTPLPNLPPPH